MEDNTFDKLKSMLNSNSIPPDLQNIVAKMASSNKASDSSHSNNEISPETISNLLSMLNKRIIYFK